MAREDIRINLSFKNNVQERILYEYVLDKSEIVGVSSFIKQLIQKAMIEEQENKK